MQLPDIMRDASQVRKVEQTFNFPTGSFARIIKERSEVFAETILAAAITELVKDLNLQNTMNDRQIIKASSLLLTEFKQLNPADVSLCFDYMRLGKYGEYYNRMDIQILSKCLNQYFLDRLDIAEQISDKAHADSKKDILIPQTIKSREEFYKGAEDLFKRIEEKSGKDKDLDYEAFKAEYYKNKMKDEEAKNG